MGMERYRESVENWDLHFTAWQQGVQKPVITAVNGICAGGAFHWVAEADIVIAASDAQFFDPHVSVGQVVAIEAIALLRKMPFEAVMRMALVGRYERMNAERAYELGMISQIVDPPDQLREVAQELGETIAKNSPAAMRATKKALWGALEHGLTDGCRAGAAASWSRCGAIPTRPRARSRSRRSANPAGPRDADSDEPGRRPRPTRRRRHDGRGLHHHRGGHPRRAARPRRGAGRVAARARVCSPGRRSG